MAIARPVSDQQIGLFLALEQAGVPLRTEQFDNRLILQKAIYLLQAARVHLGYPYRWYLRGPYSTALTEDLFYLARFSEEEKTELRTWSMDQVSRRNIQKIASLFRGTSVREMARRLELLASALFLFKTNQAIPNDVAATTKVLNLAGKPYRPQEVQEAVKTLRKHGLIS